MTASKEKNRPAKAARVQQAPRKRVVMSDVAEKAGVTRAVVSRVLNHDESLVIKPETRKKILEIAHELKYRPNSLARSLRVRRTGTIGILVPNIANPFFGMVLKGINEVLNRESFVFMLCDTSEDVRIAESLVRTMDDHQVDGLLVASAEIKDSSIRLLENYGTKYVLVTRDSDDSTAPYVGLNTYQGISTATRHLIELGHTKIAHITGNLKTAPGNTALQAYRDQMTENGLAIREDYISPSDYLETSGYNAMCSLLKLKDRPTAVAACTDSVAVNAMQAIHDFGLRIPEDISIIGYNNSWVSSLTAPKLTTIDNPLYELGKICAETLLNLINGEKCEERIILDTELIVRESTRAYPG